MKFSILKCIAVFSAAAAATDVRAADCRNDWAVARSVATPNERNLLNALEQTLPRLDEDHLVQLSRLLLDAEGEPHDLRDHPFFREFPNLRSATAEAQYDAICEALGDLADEYALGVFAAIIPRAPRVNHDPSASFLRGTRAKIRRLAAERFDRVMASSRFAGAIKTLLEHASRDEETYNALTVYSYATIREAAEGPFTFADFTATVDRLEHGRLSGRDKLLLTSVLMAFVSGLPTKNEMDQWRDSGAVTIRHQSGTPIAFKNRSLGLEAMEDIFTKRLNLGSRVADVTLAFRALALNEPLPMEVQRLRSEINEAAKRFAAGIRLRGQRTQRSVPAPPIASQPRPSPAAPGATSFVDHFMPPPVSARVKTRRIAEPADDVSPRRSDPDFEYLAPFMSGVPERRAVRDLAADVTYQFNFVRGDRDGRELVRFGPDAIAWLSENPRDAGRLLRALSLGRSYGRLPGIRYRTTVHPDGREVAAYEIANVGAHTPLILKVDGVWQMVTVVAAEKVERALRTIRPL